MVLDPGVYRDLHRWGVALFSKVEPGIFASGNAVCRWGFSGTAMMHFLSDANETFGDLTKQSSCNNGDLELRGAEQSKTHPHGHGDPPVDNDTDTACAQSPSLTNVSSFGDSVLLIIALCFHSVFEGIAIGVAETKADAWKALWTISLHKIFAAIAMGIALLRMIPDRPLLSCVAYAFAFAISSPVGVAIG
ncbi:Zinc transporter 2 [Hibiscus syriacus]|uniref:Zinc transporter 2 n=1 Tax=Hibiscus syriacus TaxID=106335 RepID=A0A6A2YLR6_HIBSY|nr:Zinc transporter 2 [Hibiscus syriacus]